MIYKLSDDYYVRALDKADLLGDYPTWFQDQEICRYNGHGKFFKTIAHFESYLNSLDQEDKIVWAICHVDDNHIGNIALQGMSFINRSAELAIILGNRKHWGKGVGSLAGKAIIGHGFYKLNLNRIYCGTSANNLGMQKLALSLGMKQEGVRRDHLYLEGEWVDMIEYGLLRTEFNG